MQIVPRFFGKEFKFSDQSHGLLKLGRAVKWDDSGDLDTDLTEEGRQQARLVGRRLAGTRFHLAGLQNLHL